MFPGVPGRLFRAHDWRSDLETLGEVPSEFVAEVSEGTAGIFAGPPKSTGSWSGGAMI